MAIIYGMYAWKAGAYCMHVFFSVLRHWQRATPRSVHIGSHVRMPTVVASEVLGKGSSTKISAHVTRLDGAIGISETGLTCPNRR
jgi:hypothetical protein